MKKWIFWTFDRGSFQYDVLCALIIVAMFAIPPAVFNDRPDYMRIPESGVVRVQDGDGNNVYTVKVDGGGAASTREAIAHQELQVYLESETELDVFRVEAVRNTRGRIQAYAFWLR
jgi:hypothetical protein